MQANLKPLTEEQWDEIQELRPRTPFESKIARSHARVRTGEPLSLVSSFEIFVSPDVCTIVASNSWLRAHSGCP